MKGGDILVAAQHPRFNAGIIRLPDGALQINYVSGADEYLVEESSDLVSWQPASLVGNITSGRLRTIQVSPFAQAKFYRLRLP